MLHSLAALAGLVFMVVAAAFTAAGSGEVDSAGAWEECDLVVLEGVEWEALAAEESSAAVSAEVELVVADLALAVLAAEDSIAVGLAAAALTGAVWVAEESAVGWIVVDLIAAASIGAELVVVVSIVVLAVKESVIAWAKAALVTGFRVPAVAN